MARVPDVKRPTATALGTILIPFQDRTGLAFVVELSRAQARELVGDIHECFSRIDREAELGAAILSIERHESVV